MAEEEEVEAGDAWWVLTHKTEFPRGCSFLVNTLEVKRAPRAIFQHGAAFTPEGIPCFREQAFVLMAALEQQARHVAAASKEVEDAKRKLTLETERYEYFRARLKLLGVDV